MNKTKIVCLLIALISGFISYSQGDYITRGWNPGEITIFSYWYWEDDYHDYQAVLRSNDYGQSLEIIHYYNMYDPTLNTPIANIYSDLSYGIIYSYTVTKFCISYDYGFNWFELTSPGPYADITAGNDYNTVFAVPEPDDNLFKSTDAGSTFEFINDYVAGIPRVGNSPEILLSNHFNYTDDTLVINYSNDTGTSFVVHSQIPFPDCGARPWGRYPNVYRGAQGEELYIVTWHYTDIGEIYFNISFSPDYGQTYTLQYSAPTFNPFDEFFHFTGGKQSGEFYYVYEQQNYSLGYFATTLKIYSSLDSAQTFNEYIHVLDSSFPVSITEHKMNSVFTTEVQAAPNPISDRTSILFNLKEDAEILYTLFDAMGKVIISEENKYFQKGENFLELNLVGLKPGLYYFRLSCGYGNTKVCKLIKK